MIWGQTTAEPFVSSVPLSCVPPWRCLGLSGATERLWNWSVERPSFRLDNWVGIRESSCWQSARSSPLNPRDEHCEDVLAACQPEACFTCTSTGVQLALEVTA